MASFERIAVGYSLRGFLASASARELELDRVAPRYNSNRTDYFGWKLDEYVHLHPLRTQALLRVTFRILQV